MSWDVIQKDFVYWYVTKKANLSHYIPFNKIQKMWINAFNMLENKENSFNIHHKSIHSFYPDSNHITSETSSTSVDLNYIFLRFTSMCTTKCSNFRRQYEKTDIIYTLSNRQWKWGKAWQKKSDWNE